jgi:hypothetical protein
MSFDLFDDADCDGLSSVASSSSGQSIDEIFLEFESDEGILPPLSNMHMEDVDRFVAHEFSKLSFTERDQALCDVHAVTDTGALQEPSLETQRTLLQQVKMTIRDEMPPVAKEAYNQAMQMDASYVHRDEFVLKFLRADGWDPKRAAARLTKHFKVKLDLFPPELLCRDIMQDDLDPQTLKHLYSDVARDLPLRDMAGRIITFIIPGPESDVLSKVSSSSFGACLGAMGLHIPRPVHSL